MCAAYSFDALHLLSQLLNCQSSSGWVNHERHRTLQFASCLVEQAAASAPPTLLEQGSPITVLLDSQSNTTKARNHSHQRTNVGGRAKGALCLSHCVSKKKKRCVRLYKPEKPAFYRNSKISWQVPSDKHSDFRGWYPSSSTHLLGMCDMAALIKKPSTPNFAVASSSSSMW